MRMLLAMTRHTMTRSSSIYTLRFTSAEHAAAAAARMPDAGINTCDRGDLTVSWRSAGDTEAIATADLLISDETPATLTTGLGVHRRTVAVN